MEKLPYYEPTIPRYLDLKVKYHNPNLIRINAECEKSDWVDLRASETVELKKGEFNQFRSCFRCAGDNLRISLIKLLCCIK